MHDRFFVNGEGPCGVLTFDANGCAIFQLVNVVKPCRIMTGQNASPGRAGHDALWKMSHRHIELGHVGPLKDGRGDVQRGDFQDGD